MIFSGETLISSLDGVQWWCGVHSLLLECFQYSVVEDYLEVLYPFRSLSYTTTGKFSLLGIVSHWDVGVHILSRQRSAAYFIKLFMLFCLAAVSASLVMSWTHCLLSFLVLFLTCLLTFLYSSCSFSFYWASLHWLNWLIFCFNSFLIFTISHLSALIQSLCPLFFFLKLHCMQFSRCLGAYTNCLL